MTSLRHWRAISQAIVNQFSVQQAVCTAADTEEYCTTCFPDIFQECEYGYCSLKVNNISGRGEDGGWGRAAVLSEMEQLPGKTIIEVFLS